MAAEVHGHWASFVAGAVRPLFDVHPFESDYVYEVTADGRRFLVNTAVEQKASTSGPWVAMDTMPSVTTDSVSSSTLAPNGLRLKRSPSC